MANEQPLLSWNNYYPFICSLTFSAVLQRRVCLLCFGGHILLQLLIDLQVLHGATQGVGQGASQTGIFSGQHVRAPVAQPDKNMAAAAAAITKPDFFMIMIIYPLVIKWIRKIFLPLITYP